MDRETKTIVTPRSNQTIVAKTYLTGREKRSLVNIYLQGNLNFNTDTKNISGIDNKLIDMEQDLSFETIIVSVDGSTEKIVDTILDMHSEDFEFVKSYVESVKTDKDFEEKKTK